MPPKSRTTRKRSFLEDHSSVNLSKSSTTRKRRLLDGDPCSANLYHAESLAESSSRPGDICVNSCNETESTIVGGSSFLGQGLYQKSRQGMTTKYEDFGDNVFACNHCGARFWLKEANKQKSKNAPIIYTNCCKKGEIKVQQSNPTPAFLEHLLNPENGPESRLFRDNIRVYNSMFSFTSMGATIDHGVNVGSGPYVFKINGQVHHLMGSMLPPDGECPKYAQLYIYDTKNEVANRINAIDPSHINEKIKPDIVQGLIKMFDEINELVKTYRMIRDKFEDNSLPSFNVTMLSRQPTDSKQYEEPTSEEISGLIMFAR
ncbi:uncharacterized protein LOC121048877 [Rosa chinensis]|uniref:uncharacterized protein LOC121048877 n=1 Tax=Rosa chinensis TaxID=74649 RepID=UPI001AD8F577|nr:uncharacterized protein LOC121048877 [Rosa chinensis]